MDCSLPWCRGMLPLASKCPISARNKALSFRKASASSSPRPAACTAGHLVNVLRLKVASIQGFFVGEKSKTHLAGRKNCVMLSFSFWIKVIYLKVSQLDTLLKGLIGHWLFLGFFVEYIWMLFSRLTRRISTLYEVPRKESWNLGRGPGW